jgi:glycosyltransferase involved in cell wall biosynthesis
VAGADPTKNVETVIEAFGRLPATLRDTHRLVLAGDVRKRRDLDERVARWGLTRQTVWTGVVSDEQLITLYQHAAAFVFPSRYEGFGLPVLEAMACGCPVISSHAASLPEVVGDAALLVDPEDVQGWVTAIEQVLTDPAVASELRARGLARAAQFSWDRTAREMVAVYEKVVHG